MKKKTKKKVAKKPRAVPAGARDVGYRERKLKEAVGEAQLQADVDEVRGICCVSGCNRPGVSLQPVSPESVHDLPVCAEHLNGSFVDSDGTPFLCGESGCFNRCVEWVEGEPLCGKHRDELVANLKALTEVFRALSEQQTRVGEAVERCIAALAPEHHVHVPPPPGPRPELPVLQPHLLEFHTVRRGLLCDMAFTVFEDVVIRRVHDRLSGGSSYSLAGFADLDVEQNGGEITSHYWHRATDEEHDALAACDPDEPPAASERLSA